MEHTTRYEICSELKHKLLAIPKLLNKSGNINANLFKIIDENTKQAIEILFPEIKISVAIHCLLNDIFDLPSCNICGEPVTYFAGRDKGFSLHCSIQCSRQDNISKEKRAATNLLRYGAINPKQNADVIEKTKANNFKKYGVTNPTMLPDVKNKISNTLLQTYQANKDTILGKKNKTFEQKYGTHPNRLDSVKQQKEVNTFAKYGVNHTTQLAQTKQKSKKTCIEKLDLVNPLQLHQTIRTL
jgi:hypothetical protein